MDKPVKTSHCNHVEAVGDNSWEDVIKRKRLQNNCEQCLRTGPNLWLCLHDRCLYVACGESGEDCSTEHGQLEKHHLTLNLTSMRIWCYKCECEVYKDGNIPPFFMHERSLSHSPPLSVSGTPEHLIHQQIRGAEYCPNISHVGHSHSRKHSPVPLEESSDDEDMDKPRGLTGLQNIGNTCYMNAALQALSNCPPLTRFFLDCHAYVNLIPPDRKPNLSRSFHKLLSEVWHNKRPAYVVPSSIASGIKMVHPMFRGYTQQDTQEFLRCFMDQIHEELKQPIHEIENNDNSSQESDESTDDKCKNLDIDSRLSNPSNQTNITKQQAKESDNEYETCESGQSSERNSVEHSLSNEQIQQATSSSCNLAENVNSNQTQDSGGNNLDKQGINVSNDQTQQQNLRNACSVGLTQSDSNIGRPSTIHSSSADMKSGEVDIDMDSNEDNDINNDVEMGDENDETNDVINYTPPVTRSAQKLASCKSSSHVTPKELSPTYSADSGIGSSYSSNSLQSIPSVHTSAISASSSHTDSTNTAHTAKDVKDSVNKAHQKHNNYSNVESNEGGNKAATTRMTRQSECDSVVDSQTSRQEDRQSKVNKSRQASETERHHNSQTTQSNISKTSHTQVPQKRKRPTQYHSIISDVFDGKVLSSVQCLTCERISTTKETFQDLSLPIPNKDHLQMIHNQPPAHMLTSGGSGAHKNSCGEVTINQGWFSWMFGWMKSWFWGPTVKLQDCLAAFFSADELKGDNMYSCEKCKKLRNGVKYSRVLNLPEILCIHLKRFRHEFMFSTKISTHVSFPMDGLDMGPYLHKDCTDQTRQYDLVAIICHHGTAGGGHYTAYCLNYINETWYEFDDQYVTAVDIQTVENCEAYVLFYRKRNDEMLSKRKKAHEIAESHENSFMKFYISKHWLNKFNTFAEPGPITNHDVLCKHGGVHPYKWDNVNGLVMEVSQFMWEYLHKLYGGGPAVTHLYPCTTCKEEMERLKYRQVFEKDTFIKLNDEFTREEWTGAIYAISISWFKLWESFVKDKTEDPPGPIDNSRICVVKGGVPLLKHNSEYGQISEEMWIFLFDIYGGGPEVLYRPALKIEMNQSQYTRQNEEDDMEMDEA